ncbi:GFA family protein [Sphingomonas jatrophae]|uniref:Uncharacterized conserved protein n=1 Tax=Sphingomonas jatrophae TaxID=1166337 RepID=A0A1I6LG35_9SPHN|nr:GFA family protein [Sphingomonas jatrophae]SFS02386.1 Uncharacterized conserved protein [Sphingomonas jatrophae]
MSDFTSREGGCRCGRVRFRITAPPLISMACHCRGCQRMTASAFSLSIAVPAGALEILAGETVAGGAQDGRVPYHHHHCGWCKSWLYTQPPAEMGFVNVRTTMLDDPSGLDPFVETQTAEKLTWAQTGAPHSFERFPPMDAFGPLVAEYQARI